MRTRALRNHPGEGWRHYHRLTLPRSAIRALTEACFIGTAPIVGIFAVGLTRAASDCALNFTKTEKRGAVAPIISRQAIGYALADAKMAIEAVRSLSLRGGLHQVQGSGAAQRR